MPVKQVFKVVIVGDKGVGKSCLIRTLKLLLEQDTPNHSSISENQMQSFELINSFASCYSPTIGINYYVYNDLLSDKYEVQIWDCSGDERFLMLVDAVFPKADALILAFDVNKYSSVLSCLNFWLHRVRRLNLDVKKLHKYTLLLGTKIDSVNLLTATGEEDLHKLAQRHDIPFAVRILFDQLAILECYVVLLYRPGVPRGPVME